MPGDVFSLMKIFLLAISYSMFLPLAGIISGFSATESPKKLTKLKINY